jgi:hypothetical protein
MKKRIYRGVNVKKVDEEKLADAVRGERDMRASRASWLGVKWPDRNDGFPYC